MDRGALIGGGAVLAALAGVGVFYFVLSSGDTGDVSDYSRETVAVEELGQPGAPAPLVKSASRDDVKVRPDVDHMGDAMRAVARHKADPKGAERWKKAREEGRIRDQELAGQQLESFFSEAHIPSEKQREMWGLFNENFEFRHSVQRQIEAGELSPREGRKLLAEQRATMKGSVIDHVGESGYENLRVRMDKVRVVVF